MGHNRVEFNVGAMDTAVRLYPTLRCNMSCTYCSNGLAGGVGLPSASKDKWVVGVKHLKDTKITRVHITGGEPFLYEGLVEIVNAVPLPLVTLVYTNLTIPPRKFLRDLRRKVIIRGSLHPPVGVEVYKAHVGEFLSHPDVSGIYLVMVAGGPAVSLYRRHFINMQDVELHSVANQWGINSKTQGVRRDARCRNKSRLFGPDGSRYPCVSHMQKGWDVSGRPLFWEVDWNKDDPWITTDSCGEYGCCTACDGLIESEVEVLGDR